VIGDSVTLGASTALREAIPGAYIDAEVNRNMRDAEEIIKTLQENGMLGETVVIALASNASDDTGDNADALVRMLGADYRVVFVTGFGKDFMAPANAHIRAMPGYFQNVVVADWETAIAAHQDWLAPDGVHTGTEESKELYAQVVVAAIAGEAEQT